MRAWSLPIVGGAGLWCCFVAGCHPCAADCGMPPALKVNIDGNRTIESVSVTGPCEALAVAADKRSVGIAPKGPGTCTIAVKLSDRTTSRVPRDIVHHDGCCEGDYFGDTTPVHL